MYTIAVLQKDASVTNEKISRNIQSQHEKTSRILEELNYVPAQIIYFLRFEDIKDISEMSEVEKLFLVDELIKQRTNNKFWYQRMTIEQWQK